MSKDKLGARRDGWFMRSAAAVGDLANPFYAEERQRDVWNEASAVGFQVMLWLGLIAANVMIWLGQGTALPYAFGVFLLLGVASWIVWGYACRLGVEADATVRLWRWPMVPFGALMLLFLLGIARASGGVSLSPSTLIGAATGGLVVVLFWFAARLVRRRRALADGPSGN